MTQRVEITDAQLASWRVTGHAYKCIAALIVEWARGQERGTQVPENEFFAGKLDVVVSASPYRRAREWLEAHGVLYTNDGPHMVA
jgi:hypothetical protein